MRRLRNCNVTTVAPDRDHLDHRRLQLGDRAALRRGVHAESGRRADAGRQRGLRRHRQGRGLVQRGPDAADRRGGAHRLPRGARAVAAGLRHRQPHQARVAHPDAGGVPGVQRQRHLQDLQLRQRRERGVRRGDLSPRLSAQLQGRHGLSRRQPRHAGAEHGHHRQEGAGAGHVERQGRGPGRPGARWPAPRRRRATGRPSPRCPSSRGRWPSSRPRTSGSGGWCTTSRRRTSSAARSAHGPSCCAAPPAASKRRSARSTSRSPRTTAGSRSRCS